MGGKVVDEDEALGVSELATGEEGEGSKWCWW